ncbi:MAG: alpha-N-acetylglucosaminidase C-terminal domain-containing protein [Clostridiales bacterium]|jgi:alpha-N-acetylglucosaminidase|nr:alpha-N-acetylglucosaminidase C-terminal domain-containing protein [Clostridiales bacterium]
MSTTTKRSKGILFAVLTAFAALLICAASLLPFTRPASAFTADEQAAFDRITAAKINKIKSANNRSLIEMSTSGMSVTANSQQSTSYGANKMLDASESTAWEAKWDNPPAIKTLTFTLGSEAKLINGIRYRNRNGNLNIDGCAKAWTIETSKDGTTWVTGSDDGGTDDDDYTDMAVPYSVTRVGESHIIPFSPLYAKYIRVSSATMSVVTTWRFYYIPTAAAEIDTMTTEAEGYLADAATLTTDTQNKDWYLSTVASELYREYHGYQDQGADAVSGIKDLPSGTEDERVKKGRALFSYISKLLRSISEDPTVLAAQKEEADMYLTAATIGEDPLEWPQSAVDALQDVYDDAAAVADVVEPWGDVHDAKRDLTAAVNKFKLAYNRPEITYPGGDFAWNNKTKDECTESLMDGTFERRLSITTAASNFDGTKYIQFDYGADASFKNATVSGWFATEQAPKTFQLEYWDASLNDGAGGWTSAGGALKSTAGAAKGSYASDTGIYTPSWSGNTSSTDTVVVEFGTLIETSKLRFIPRSYGKYAFVVDEIGFGLDVAASDISVAVSGGTNGASGHPEINELASLQLFATVLPFYAPEKRVTWKSSDPVAASVSPTGLVTGGSVAPNEYKDVTITATSMVEGATPATKVIRVKKAPLSGETLAQLERRLAIQRAFAAKQSAADYKADAVAEFKTALNTVEGKFATATLGSVPLLITEINDARAALNAKNTGVIGTVKNIINRVTGQNNAADRFTIEVIKKDETTGRDVFELDWAAGKPVLRGSDGVSIATAFNYYLKYFCYRDFPYTGEWDASLPETLPAVTADAFDDLDASDAAAPTPTTLPFRNVFPHVYRHYGNETDVEYKYTMDVWSLDQWQRRLDWLAMNGFNMFQFDFDLRKVWLSLVGDSAFDTGMTAEQKAAIKSEIKKSTGGDFTPDFSNYEVADATLDIELDKAREVLKRAYAVGLEPEVKPFYGFVPFMFYKDSDRNAYYGSTSTGAFNADLPNTILNGIRIIRGAYWLNMPQGVSISYYKSDGDDTAKAAQAVLYDKIDGLYYKHFTKVFGFDDLGRTPIYFYKDLVNEAGFIVQHTDYPQSMLGIIEQRLMRFNPDMQNIMTTWRIANWQMTYLSEKHTLLVDLHAERNPKHNSIINGQNEFGGRKWIWDMLYNFGGNNGINSDLKLLSYAVNAKLDTDGIDFLSGVGIAPEGADTDPATYAMMAENTWRLNTPRSAAAATDYVAAWVRKYQQRRYGFDNVTNASAELTAAWDTLLSTAYSAFYGSGTSGDGPAQNMVSAMPRLEGAKARYWGGHNSPYDRKKILQLWRQMIEAAEAIGPANLTPQFEYDLVDFSRQVLADLSDLLYPRIKAAYQGSDKAEALTEIQRIIDICADLETLLATNKGFMVGPKLEGARGRGATENDSDYYEEFERAYMTIWVPDHPEKAGGGAGLVDYCNRHFAGMMNDYYKARWQKLYELTAAEVGKGSAWSAALSATNGGINGWYNAWAMAWTKDVGPGKYPTQTTGDAFTVAKELMRKYEDGVFDLVGGSTMPATDKDDLLSVIESCDSLSEGDYTASSWAAFAQRLTEAATVYDDRFATQRQINAARAALQSAKDALVQKGTEGGDAGGGPGGGDAGDGSGGESGGGNTGGGPGGKKKGCKASAGGVSAMLALLFAGGAGLVAARKKRRN